MCTERVYGAAYSPEIRGRRWWVCSRSACMAQPTRLRFAGEGGGTLKVVRTLRMRLLIPNHRLGDDEEHLTHLGLHGFFLHRRRQREPITHNQ